MSNNQTKAVPQEISSIIEHRDSCIDFLKGGLYTDFLESMELLLIRLTPKEVQSKTVQECLATVRQEKTSLRRIRGRTSNGTYTARKIYGNRRASVYTDILQKVNGFLWTFKYLPNGSGSNFYDPSGGRKSGKHRLPRKR